MDASRLLGSRTLGLAALAAVLGFGGTVWYATRAPDWSAWAGETSIAVQVGGTAPAPDRVRVRASAGGTEFRGTVHGDRLRFTGLEPDTGYVLDWRVGPFTPATRTVRTLPALLPALNLEVSPGRGELAIRLRANDPRLSGVEMQLAAAGRPLAKQGEQFAVKLPESGGTVELTLVLPGPGEEHALDFPVLGTDALLEELSRAEADLESLLRTDPAPSLIEPSALDRWEPAPLPARHLASSAGPGLLARLRRLAPQVRAMTAGEYPAATRWRLALGATRLAGAEVLARLYHQPGLGVLDWAPELVRFAPLKSTRQLRVKPLVRFPAHIVHPTFEGTAASTLVQVFGGTQNSKFLPSLDLELGPPGPSPWIGISMELQAVFNSGPPVLRFPKAGVAIELPLVQRGPPGKFGVDLDFASTFPRSLFSLWVRRVPAEADWTAAVIEPSHRPRSKRISPTYVAAISQNDEPPPER